MYSFFSLFDIPAADWSQMNAHMYQQLTKMEGNASIVCTPLNGIDVSSLCFKISLLCSAENEEWCQTERKPGP